MAIVEQVSSSVSCSSNPQWKYDVFLSRSGTDTRYNFTDHLYNALLRKGINTYMDDPEIPKGEEISSELLQAIQDSKISIIVFSENYASSSWCLDELVKILKCKKSNQQVVHPVFYQVEPSDIRHLKGSFGEALAKHECRFKDNLEKVQEWKNALSEAANLSGWILPMTNMSESTLINDIVEEISKQLISRTYLDVGKHSVGINRRVQAVKNRLRNLEGKDVRMVGIWGTGGIGKTTLAKAVYNSIALQFEGCCFLENVRENSMSLHQSIDYSKICKLQKKLLSQILGGKQITVDSTAKGITMIKERLQCKRVLLVLDDVSNMDQLRNLAGESGWFGKGSTVIITTRDMQLLRAHKVDLVYNIEELDYDEAFELFCRNALKRNEPLEVYKDIIDRAIVHAQGLPLALSVLGSYLRGKRVERWQATIDSFRSNKIQEILKISYDGLEETTKEVFLYIACFFNGTDRRHVIKMLRDRDCCLNPEHDIDILKKKSLIWLDYYDRVRMDDTLEEMGKDIVLKMPRSRITEANKRVLPAGFFSSDCIFLIINLCLESLSLAFDQTASFRKPYFGLIGMLLAIVALLVSVGEFLYTNMQRYVKLGTRPGFLWWFHALFGSVPDSFGIGAGLVQSVSSAVQFFYLLHHEENPIKVSLLPALLLICLISVKLTKCRQVAVNIMIEDQG